MSSRFDDIGLFWQDIKIERVAAPKVVISPPDPVWLKDDYLPFLEEARAWVPDLMTRDELLEVAENKDPLVWDCEVYPNYFLVGFMSVKTRKIVMFELRHHGSLDADACAWINWIISNCLIVGFNDTSFDLPIIACALAGYEPDQIQGIADRLIKGGKFGTGETPRDVLKSCRVAPVVADHIDLIELTPLGPSLKVCAGRLHAPMMMDLPFSPGKELTDDQITILRWYWQNDLVNTRLLYLKHKPIIDLRCVLTDEYSVDVRSRSDPQIAEAVIREEIKRILGRKHLPPRAEINPGETFQYVPPAYVAFQSPTMCWVLDFIKRQEFVIGMKGEPVMPKELEDLVVPIGDTRYSMGIGGLHSQEKRMIYVSDDEWELSDNDVTSYYPSLIIQQGMYPPRVGPAFLQVFTRIVDRRVAAKDAGDKTTAEVLKIVANGTFGKTGERGGWSVVYYPRMMIQVTLSGQLSLMMLIERLELAGISVISANTDGIVIRCRRSMLDRKAAIIKQWEHDTGLRMESALYRAIYSRDVNNYLAFYEKPKGEEYAKAKGVYAPATLKKNPTSEICTEAVVLFLAKGIPIEKTIGECTDLRKFVEVRLVRGGACKDGEYLGKAIRWYYAKETEGAIINAKNGHTVPKSQGARPCMRLPETMPDDIDRSRYIEKAYEILEAFSPEKSVELEQPRGDEE